nr:uncharacterized protein LOC118878096 isoform X2 [Drosophila suzukii]
MSTDVPSGSPCAWAAPHVSGMPRVWSDLLCLCKKGFFGEAKYECSSDDDDCSNDHSCDNHMWKIACPLHQQQYHFIDKLTKQPSSTVSTKSASGPTTFP